MIKLTEQDIEQAYIGKPCNKEKLNEIFTQLNNRNSYYFHWEKCNALTRLHLGITPALYLTWQQRNIEFKIEVGVNDSVITYCRLIKYKNSNRGLYDRSPVREPKPTQQELRLFKRVMEYITQ